MNKALKQTFAIIFVISLTLNWAGYGFIDNTIENNHTGFCIECTSSSNGLEHSHFDFCEDDLFIGHNKQKNNILLNMSCLAQIASTNYKSLLSSDIWQPPKFSYSKFIHFVLTYDILHITNL